MEACTYFHSRTFQALRLSQREEGTTLRCRNRFVPSVRQRCDDAKGRPVQRPKTQRRIPSPVRVKAVLWKGKRIQASDMRLLVVCVRV